MNGEGVARLNGPRDCRLRLKFAPIGLALSQLYEKSLADPAGKELC